MVEIIVLLIIGLIVGYGGRLILPGAQDIGMLKTLLVGVASALIVGIIGAVLTSGGFGTVATIIVGSLVAAGLLWLSIRQGWLRPTPG